jgi:catechol 2,3-dioxygenase-like lactoylglutathione lyase family enzyme
MSTVETTTAKFHISLNVSDLEASVAYYRALFGQKPATKKRDYAKFELAEPPVVLSLIPGRAGTSGNLNHAGLRVPNAEALVQIQARLDSSCSWLRCYRPERHEPVPPRGHW